jgi:hypothetical protein
MKTTVDELVMQVSTSSPTEQDAVRHHIELLDSIDSRFSSAALRLVNEPRDGLAAAYVISYLRAWVVDSGTMESADKIAEHRAGLLDVDYSTPLVVLGNSTAAKSVATMTLTGEYSLSAMIRGASDGDFCISKLGIFPRPDLMQASHEELNRYYRPIAVAGILLNINGDGKRFVDTQPFIDEAPAFLTWISAQPNIDQLLAAALQSKSLVPTTIEAIAAMQQVTPQPFHDGLI